MYSYEQVEVFPLRCILDFLLDERKLRRDVPYTIKVV